MGGLTPSWPTAISPLTIATPSCARCHGLGVVRARSDLRAWHCVLRAVCRTCLAHYYVSQVMMAHAHAVAFERVRGPGGRPIIRVGNRHAEYSADFVLAARRALAGRPVEWRVFHLHFLQGHQWRRCVRIINRVLRLAVPLTEGTFFRAVYRAEVLIGSTILASRPYRLYPPAEYLSF